MELIYAIVRAAVGVGVVVLLTRVNGLKTFSKMSAFDFALTLAIGSTLAAIVTAGSPSVFWTAMAALIALYAAQGLLMRVRNKWDPVRRRLDNSPLLLMENGEIIDGNLTRGKVTRADLFAKLREANVLRMEDVRAVVLEATGDVSVLHGQTEVEPVLLEGALR